MLSAASKQRVAWASHEEEFLLRYSLLSARSLQLTGDRERAKDLLHDAFVQFVINLPNIEKIESVQGLDAYLCKLVRNLYLSQVVLASQAPRNNVPLADYDSAELALRSKERNLCSQINAQQELLKICRFTFARREKSKEASILILRFFHGYYPSELTRLINCTEFLVRNFLKTARRDVKDFLQCGESEKPRSGFLPSCIEEIRVNTSSLDFLAGLREGLLRPQNGHCFSQDKLAALYFDSRPLDRVVLAHVVHCAYCLDQLNQLRGLAPLSERCAFDTVGQDKRKRKRKGKGSGDGKPPGSGLPPGTTRELDARTKETVEHRPGVLRVTINGHVVGSQTVTSAFNELLIGVDLPLEHGFLEVFSEQDVRLLSMDIEPPPNGSAELRHGLDLSDGRTLEVEVIGSGPSLLLKVTYCDPTFDTEDQEGAELVRARPFLVVDAPQEIESSPALPSVIEQTKAWINESVFRLRWPRPASYMHISKWMTPAVALIVAVAVLVYEMRPEVVSAAELLNRSARIEETEFQDPKLAEHSSLTMEEFDYPSMRPVNRQRIEVWQNGAKRVRLRRLYDENSRLIGEARIAADGTKKVHKLGSGARLAEGEGSSALDVLRSDNIWTLDLSAKTFSSLMAEPGMTSINRSTNAYQIDYKLTNPTMHEGRAVLRSAVLTLEKSTLHPINARLLVQEGDATHEFQIRESAFVRLPAGNVDPNLFEPNLPDVSVNASHPAVHANAPSRRKRKLATLAGLQVDALYRLSRLAPELENQLSVDRRNGRLEVQGTVDSQERKNEVLSALAPFLKHPAFRVNIRSVDEALEKQLREDPEPIISRDVEISKSSIPVSAELARFFQGMLDHNSGEPEKLSPDTRVRRQIRELSTEVLHEAYLSYLHAFALRNLTRKLSLTEVVSLDGHHLAEWEELVNSHAQAVEVESRAIRQELEPIFFAGEGLQKNVGRSEKILVTSKEELANASAHLFELATLNQETIVSTFTVSGKDAGQALSDVKRLRESLLSLEVLAAKISSRR